MAGDAVKANLARAIDAMRGGRFDEATRALEADGAALLNTSVGRNIRGDIFLKQERYQDALKAFDAAVRLAPNAPEGYCNRGVALMSLGRLDEALSALDRALRYRPNFATVHFNRGNVLKALGRNEDAIAAYSKAVAARPDYPEALVNRGTALLAVGGAFEALGDFGRALGFEPGQASAHIGQAKAHRDLAQYDLALAAVTAAQNTEPNNSEIARLRHRILFAAERFEEALAEVDTFLARDPADAAAYRERAGILLKLDRSSQALEAANESIRLQPDEGMSHVVRGQILNDLGRYEDSLAEFDEASRLGVSESDLFGMRAVANAIIGAPAEALADFAAALALNPDDAQVHSNRAFLQVSLGNWEDGWPEHEWRLKSRRNAPPPGIKQFAPWQGEPLAGKRLLAYAEQGHGDTFQFVRYLKQIERGGVTVTLHVPRQTRRLLAESFPAIDVVEALPANSEFDYRASLMSMPAIFGTIPATVPAEVPYLLFDPVRVDKWARRIGDHGFRVGVVWQGNRNYARDRDRSVPVSAFAPLARVPGVRLISVQAMVGLDQLDNLPAGMAVERLGDELENNPDGFREMAAIMTNLDLLVMSDTGPTHLAAALGRPVWMATAKYADWRWMREGETTPWYPTMRLFRQETAGDWEGVFARIAKELEQAVSQRSNKAEPRPSPG